MSHNCPNCHMDHPTDIGAKEGLEGVEACLYYAQGINGTLLQENRRLMEIADARRRHIERLEAALPVEVAKKFLGEKQ